MKLEELTKVAVESITVDAVATGTSSAAALLGDMSDFLLTGYWNTGYGDGTRSHNVTSTGIDANNGVLHYNLSGYSADADGLTADRAVLVREAFKLFEATLGIQFVETTSTDTNLVDFFFRDNDSGAYASHSYYNSGALGSTIHYAQINVAQSWSGGTSTYDDYTLQTILHEIGHAIGLGHQGPYNGSATYGVDNVFANDSWQASMMSYFSQTENTSINASYAFLQTPMAVDWMALDVLYGRQGYGVSNAFTEDTVWGFNTTVTSGVSDIWAQWSTYANRTASTLVDGGGIDTLDLSGYSNSTLINLAPSEQGATFPSLSNIGGRIGNLAMAEGTIIENAIGGAGSEVFYGNVADNTFTGNGGDDTFYDSVGSDTYHGDAGSDQVIFGATFASYTIEVVSGVLRVIDTAIDWVADTVEWLAFADQKLSWQAVADTAGAVNTPPVAANDAYSVTEGDLLSATDLLANDSDGDGGILSITSVNGQATGTTISLASGALVTVQADGSFDYDQNGAFDSLNSGEQATDGFSYTVSDGQGGTDIADVSIVIDGVTQNAAPVAGNDAYSVTEGDLL
ncbi:Ig-like domain-containing protein, partial [Marivita geojedonensis]|uniref:Ig-like domain-containing protein n=1 Tax=Marivita geojedonensis TaxID=1123756 RepID=UPI001E3426B2